MTLKHLRSSTVNKRPQASGMADGQLAINTASGSPGLFFKDAAGNVVKIGPVHVGSGAPNVSPASGGTSGNSIGEQWLDNSGGTYVFKVWDGSAWRSESGEFVNVTGDTMTGSLTMGPAATLIFEGSVDDGFETTLTVANPTADQTITLPNITGTVVTTGDTGTVTSTMIADGTIVNADVNASAAIAGTKISPDFGSQNRTSTGTSTAASFIPTSSGAPTNGLYLSAANTVALATNSTGKLFVDPNGQVGVGKAVPLDDLHIASTTPAIVLDETDAGTDEKYWRMRAEGSILRFEGINDAFNTATSWLNVTRSAGARTADNIAFATGTVEKVRINASGQVLIGSQGVSYATPLSTSLFPLVQTHVVGSAQAQSVIANWGIGTDVGPSLSLCRADSGAIGTYTPAIGSADVLGNIRFNGSDGTKFIEGVKISAVADGTWSSDNGPTSLRFSTTPSGTAVVERLRITASGRVGIGTNLGTWTPGATLDVRSGSDNTAVEEIAAFARPDGAVRASINKGVVSGNGISFGTTTNHPLVLRTNATERIVIGAAGTTTLTSDASTAPFIVNIDASEVARIDSSGKLLVGASSAIATRVTGTSITPPLQVAGAALSNSSSLLANYSTAATSSSYLLFSRSKSGTVGTNTVVVANDRLGAVSFAGYDGTNQTEAARILSEVDGTVTTDGMPGRLSLWTSASGSNAPTERLRITNAGRLGLATTAPAALAHIAGDTIVSNVDLANASYDNISFSIAGQEASPTGLFFSPDGRKMFVTGSTDDDVNEYTLSTPWNVSTAVYVTAFSVTGQDTVPQDLYFRNDGKKLYIIGSTNDAVYQYSLSTPWSIASASYDSISFAVGTQDSTAVGVFFKPDGLTLYMLGTTNDTVYQYTLSTAWNVSTAVLSGSFSVLAQESGVNAISFTADGSRMFIMGSTGDDVNIYNLTTPWDVTTSSFVTVFSIAAQDVSPVGLFVKPDGTKFYIAGNTNDTVYQYTIPSATIDLTGTTNINGNANIAQNLTINGEIVGAGALMLSTADTGGTPTPRVNITADGKVGIGTAISTGSRLAVQEATAGQAIVLYSPDGNGAGYIGTTNQAGTSNGLVINGNRGNGSIVFETNSNERARIDTSGRLLVGATTARANYPGSVAPVLQVNTALGVGFERNTNDDNPIHIWLGKSRGTVAGANTIVNSSDSLAAINFTGADGSTLIAAAKISAEVDGTPGLNDMPGRIVLSTTADGASAPTERMRISNAGTTTLTSAASTAPFIANISASEVARIDSSGRLLVGTSSARTVDVTSTTMIPQLQLEGLSAAASSFSIIRNDASASPPYLVFGKSRSGSLSGATAVVTNDSLGALLFEGTDGTAMVEAASVNAEVDGTVASGVMPGRLIFSTTASGASSPSERFRITSDGVQCYSQSAPATYASGVTLTTANLKTGIVQYSGGTATLTLPTGSGVESGFTGIYTNMTFDWSVINTGSGICTVGSGIGHTVTGSAIVSSGTSGRFATRRTAANVFVSYRLS